MNYLALIMNSILIFQTLCVEIRNNVISRGQIEVSLDGVHIHPNFYWSIVDNLILNFVGGITVDSGAGFYVTSHSRSFQLRISLLGVIHNILNDGIISLNARNSLIAPDYQLIGNSFVNNGEFYLSGDSRYGEPIYRINSVAWRNNGLLVVYQATKSNSIMEFGAIGTSIMNAGTICLTNVDFDQKTAILGGGCIVLKQQSSLILPNALLVFSQLQTIYMEDQSSIVVEALSTPQTFKVANFGSGKKLALTTTLAPTLLHGSWGYDSRTGILTLYTLALSQKFNIGTGYNVNLFSISSATSSLIPSINNAIVYSGRPPNSNLPSNCMPCKDVPDSPGSVPTITTTAVVSTLPNGNLATGSAELLISTNANGNWFTTTNWISYSTTGTTEISSIEPSTVSFSSDSTFLLDSVTSLDSIILLDSVALSDSTTLVDSSLDSVTLVNSITSSASPILLELTTPLFTHYVTTIMDLNSQSQEFPNAVEIIVSTDSNGEWYTSTHDIPESVEVYTTTIHTLLVTSLANGGISRVYTYTPYEVLISSDSQGSWYTSSNTIAPTFTEYTYTQTIITQGLLSVTTYVKRVTTDESGAWSTQTLPIEPQVTSYRTTYLTTNTQGLFETITASVLISSDSNGWFMSEYKEQFTTYTTKVLDSEETVNAVIVVTTDEEERWTTVTSIIPPEPTEFVTFQRTTNEQGETVTSILQVVISTNEQGVWETLTQGTESQPTLATIVIDGDGDEDTEGITVEVIITTDEFGQWYTELNPKEPDFYSYATTLSIGTETILATVVKSTNRRGEFYTSTYFPSPPYYQTYTSIYETSVPNYGIESRVAEFIVTRDGNNSWTTITNSFAQSFTNFILTYTTTDYWGDRITESAQILITSNRIGNWFTGIYKIFAVNTITVSTTNAAGETVVQTSEIFTTSLVTDEVESSSTPSPYTSQQVAASETSDSMQIIPFETGEPNLMQSSDTSENTETSIEREYTIYGNVTTYTTTYNETEVVVESAYLEYSENSDGVHLVTSIRYPSHAWSTLTSSILELSDYTTVIKSIVANGITSTIVAEIIITTDEASEWTTITNVISEDTSFVISDSGSNEFTQVVIDYNSEGILSTEVTEITFATNYPTVIDSVDTSGETSYIAAEIVITTDEESEWITIIESISEETLFVVSESGSNEYTEVVIDLNSDGEWVTDINEVTVEQVTVYPTLLQSINTNGESATIAVEVVVTTDDQSEWTTITNSISEETSFVVSESGNNEVTAVVVDYNSRGVLVTDINEITVEQATDGPTLFESINTAGDTSTIAAEIVSTTDESSEWTTVTSDIPAVTSFAKSDDISNEYTQVAIDYNSEGVLSTGITFATAYPTVIESVDINGDTTSIAAEIAIITDEESKWITITNSISEETTFIISESGNNEYTEVVINNISSGVLVTDIIENPVEQTTEYPTLIQSINANGETATIAAEINVTTQDQGEWTTITSSISEETSFVISESGKNEYTEVVIEYNSEGALTIEVTEITFPTEYPTVLESINEINATTTTAAEIIITSNEQSEWTTITNSISEETSFFISEGGSNEVTAVVVDYNSDGVLVTGISEITIEQLTEYPTVIESVNESGETELVVAEMIVTTDASSMWTTVTNEISEDTSSVISDNGSNEFTQVVIDYNSEAILLTEVTEITFATNYPAVIESVDTSGETSYIAAEIVITTDEESEWTTITGSISEETTFIISESGNNEYTEVVIDYNSNGELVTDIAANLLTSTDDLMVEPTNTEFVTIFETTYENGQVSTSVANVAITTNEESEWVTLTSDISEAISLIVSNEIDNGLTQVVIISNTEGSLTTRISRLVGSTSTEYPSLLATVSDGELQVNPARVVVIAVELPQWTTITSGISNETSAEITLANGSEIIEVLIISNTEGSLVTEFSEITTTPDATTYPTVFESVEEGDATETIVAEVIASQITEGEWTTVTYKNTEETSFVMSVGGNSEYTMVLVSSGTDEILTTEISEINLTPTPHDLLSISRTTNDQGETLTSVYEVLITTTVETEYITITTDVPEKTLFTITNSDELEFGEVLITTDFLGELTTKLFFYSLITPVSLLTDGNTIDTQGTDEYVWTTMTTSISELTAFTISNGGYSVYTEVLVATDSGGDFYTEINEVTAEPKSTEIPTVIVSSNENSEYFTSVVALVVTHDVTSAWTTYTEPINQETFFTIIDDSKETFTKVLITSNSAGELTTEFNTYAVINTIPPFVFGSLIQYSTLSEKNSWISSTSFNETTSSETHMSTEALTEHDSSTWEPSIIESTGDDGQVTRVLAVLSSVTNSNNELNLVTDYIAGNTSFVVSDSDSPLYTEVLIQLNSQGELITYVRTHGISDDYTKFPTIYVSTNEGGEVMTSIAEVIVSKIAKVSSAQNDLYSIVIATNSAGEQTTEAVQLVMTYDSDLEPTTIVSNINIETTFIISNNASIGYPIEVQIISSLSGFRTSISIDSSIASVDITSDYYSATSDDVYTMSDSSSIITYSTTTPEPANEASSHQLNSLTLIFTFVISVLHVFII